MNTRKTLAYETYADKVYGCFLGKCIGGTAGGPAEGRKELLDFPLCEELLHQALPNDDLDLQIMWLELIEDYGFDITARDMAKAFYEKVPYGPGEYAAFQKNYARGIYPPVSGSFNNRYYKNGMGCPIRSEIWACLFPGAPKLAEKYVRMDGSLDHEHDSIDAEVFLAALESSLFFTDDLRGALREALTCVPENTKLGRALRDTIRWHDEGLAWKNVRARILRAYGHADCTNLYQNMSFTLLALLYGRENFRETIRLGLACGYDTDCICATAASVLGILRGGRALLDEDGMSDTGLKIEVLTRRRTGSIHDLARDVCAAGVSASEMLPGAAVITDAPALPRVPSSRPASACAVSALYDGDPVVSPDAPASLRLSLASRLAADETVSVTIEAPEGVRISPEAATLLLPTGGAAILPCSVSVMPGAPVLHEQNLFRVTVRGSFGTVEDTFGVVGAAVWFRYGPFLENCRDLTFLAPSESYGAHLICEPGENGYDLTREYHLGGVARIGHAFVDEAAPFTAIPEDERAETAPERICLGEDYFDTAEIQSYEGAHVDYLLRRLYSPAERRIELAVGHSAPFKLWLNGEFIGGSDQTKWWTCENMHFSALLHEGENRLILKCAQQSDHAGYSLWFRIDGGRWRQYADLGSYLTLE